MANSKKFLQTKLQFGTPQAIPPITAKNADSNSSLSIEEKVDRLNIGSKHPHVCPSSNCKENGNRIICEFVKADGSSCGLSWCDDCISQFVIEYVTDIKKKNSWACPVCRKLCKCAFCDQSNGPSSSPNVNSRLSSESKRLQYGLAVRSISPPPFSHIPLAYSEEETWLRLQIREFLYQFGDTCQIEPRIIMGLQNVQADWRIRRLSGVLVWQTLKVIGVTSNNGQEGNTGNNNLISDQIRRLARDIINSWATDFGLTRTAIPNTNERLGRAGEIMTAKGMNCSRWQDVAELLAKANYKNLPIPTTTSTTEPVDVQTGDNDDDGDHSGSDGESDDGEEAMDTSSEYEDSDHEVEKFRELRRSPLSTEQELRLVQMVLDLLLMHGKIRQDMMDTVAVKDLRAADEELRNATRLFEAEDLRRKSNRSQLKMRIDQFRALGDKDMCQALENELKDLCQSIESHRAQMDRTLLDALAAQLRFSKKRLQRLITPWDGNEYWLFHDLLTPQQHYDGNRAEKNCKERWWAHGVVLIGRCPTLEDEQEQEQEQEQKRRWWHLDGIDNIQKLDKWLANTVTNKKQKGMDWALWDTAAKDIDAFRTLLAQRIDYLRLLERNIYGDDFFSQG
ncbi:hypothetical protein BCR42DRAFT_416019 [Absidia repens]|uniref:Zinc-finger domain-containing protein n=1 Tax=Absidia repens TaxID=90262 RepID=A0A1X2IG54_9FUNG|nr:hypothetical protein BCR42DRAFT_416019 [Absidia repens]